MSERPTDALAVARAALGSPPAGLVSDLDGTLSPIVTDPAAARAEPGAREALEALTAQAAVVAIVTGRSAADARRIMGSDRVLVVGNHGLEWLPPGAPRPEPVMDRPASAGWLGAILPALPAGDGITVEDKGLSLTVHYRNAPDPAAARDAIVAALRPRLPADIVLRHGRMTVEVRPRSADKGAAVTAVVERHALRGLVVLGDDVTDLDMFRAARTLSAAGRLVAACIGVAGGAESPPELAREADALLPSTRSAVGLLQQLAAT